MNIFEEPCSKNDMYCTSSCRKNTLLYFIQMKDPVEQITVQWLSKITLLAKQTNNFTYSYFPKLMYTFVQHFGMKPFINF